MKSPEELASDALGALHEKQLPADFDLIRAVVGAIEADREQRTPRLIVLTGGAATGKTTFAREWAAVDPGHRAVANDAIVARLLIEQGINVALDLEVGEQFPGEVLRGLSYEVKHLTFDPAKGMNA